MKKFQNKYFVLLSLIFGLGFYSSCNEDLQTVETSGLPTSMPLRVFVNFDGNFELPGDGTRTIGINNEDHYTFGNPSARSFATGDVAGIFTRSGNMNAPNGNGPLINVPMFFENVEYPTANGTGTETKQTFVNDTVDINVAAMNANGVFIYYPYSPDFGSIWNYNQETLHMQETEGHPWNGWELRTKYTDTEGNESIRCRDLIEAFQASNTSSGVLTGAFYHGFSEIVIIRGDGFKNPPEGKEDIKVVFANGQGYSHARIISVLNDRVYWTVQFYYKKDYTFDGEPMTEEQCREWLAWQGEDYEIDGADGIKVKQPAYYALIPSVYRQNTSTADVYKPYYTPRPTVSYIELYDDQGYKQQVTGFTFKISATAAETKQPYPYYRFPVVISMTELGPTARPVTIGEWNEEGEDKNLTDIRTVGIGDWEEYNNWTQAYNTYRSNPIEANEEGLKKYGDKINNIWHFYINGDIDFKDRPVGIVNNFQDILESSNEIYNSTLANMNITQPLFTQISGNGSIRNLNFKSIYLDSSSSNLTGCIAGSINGTTVATGSTGGVISGVNIINGTAISNGPIGLLSGSMNNGLITGCSFSGFIMGASTSPIPLFGTTPTTMPVIENTNYNDVIFTANQ